jgi:hypothetical protein
MAMAIEMGLLQVLASRKGATITADEMANETNSDKLLTGASSSSNLSGFFGTADMLDVGQKEKAGVIYLSIALSWSHCASCPVRIMRMLTALDIGTELGAEVYTSNPNGDYLARPSSIGAMKFMSTTTLKNMANVVPYMRSQGGVFHQFPDRSRGQVSAAEHAYGMPLWGLFRADPESLADFTAYLSGRREGVVNQWFDIFPAAERLQALLKNSHGGNQGEQQPPLIVDVGGNVGYDLQSFRKKHPEMEGRYILQDLPENINKAKTLLAGTGIESMEYDFFTPQPMKGMIEE